MRRSWPDRPFRRRVTGEPNGTCNRQSGRIQAGPPTVGRHCDPSTQCARYGAILQTLERPEMSAAFSLHPQLAADTLELARWPLSLVLLMDEGRFPWLVLVPQRAGLRELHDLPAAERGTLIEEIARAGRLMQSALRADKVNTAALGRSGERR